MADPLMRPEDFAAGFAQAVSDKPVAKVKPMIEKSDGRKRQTKRAPLSKEAAQLIGQMMAQYQTVRDLEKQVRNGWSNLAAISAILAKQGLAPLDLEDAIQLAGGDTAVAIGVSTEYAKLFKVYNP